MCEVGMVMMACLPYCFVSGFTENLTVRCCRLFMVIQTSCVISILFNGLVGSEDY